MVSSMLSAIFVIVVWVTVFPACLMSCGVVNQSRVSDHFDGERFTNREKTRSYSLAERFQWIRSTKLAEWPVWIDDPKYPAPPREVGLGKLRITHINHATMLIQIDGVNILTDPIWSERASFIPWMGPKRIRAPGVDIEDLPRIDLILISHNHYDHLDLATLRHLSESHKPTIIVGLGVEQLLASSGFGSVVELDWWQVYDALPNGLKVVFVPARHGSGRGFFDHDKTLWGGFVITSTAGNVYFAGDTGYGDFFGDISKRFGPLRLAILPIGHYEPRWMMEPVHMSPDDAVRAHVLLKSRQSVGMHFGTFHGAGAHNNETFDQHVSDLGAALEQRAVPASEFQLLGFGEGKDML